MKAIHLSTLSALSRRGFLRGTGVALGLPLLDAMIPAFARAGESKAAPRRFFAVCNNLGLLPGKFFPAPEQSGRDYQLSPYLEMLEAHRSDFTVFSGDWHPDVDAAHPADNCFLTAAPHPGRGGLGHRIPHHPVVAGRNG